MTAYKPIVGTPTSKALIADLQARIGNISEAQLVENILIEFTRGDMKAFISYVLDKQEEKQRERDEAKAAKYQERLAKGKAERAENKFEKPIAKAAKRSKIKEEPEYNEEVEEEDVVEEEEDKVDEEKNVNNKKDI